MVMIKKKKFSCWWWQWTTTTTRRGGNERNDFGDKGETDVKEMFLNEKEVEEWVIIEISDFMNSTKF